MDLSKIAFSNFSCPQVQELLQSFLEVEERHEFIDGRFIRHPKRLSAAFIQQHLECPDQKAGTLLAELIEGRYLDPERLTPLARGMALAQEKVRPRISRGEADRIVVDLVAAAKAANDRTGARVFVERLEIFGSYLSDSPDLGDVDVIAIIPLPEDCIPEDMDERDEASALLQVSDYVSLTDEFDHVAVGAAKMAIFTRDPQ